MKILSYILTILLFSITLISCSGKNQYTNLGGAIGAIICGGTAFALTKGGN